MSVLTKYSIKNFWDSFFPIFSALVLIVSIAFFIQISTQTAYLKISFSEIIQLYFYYTPEILLYTLPVSFFAGAIISLGKLSFDLELIVIFALQGSTKMIIKALSVLAILATAILLVVGLWLKPKAMLKAKEMIYSKEDSSQLNLKPSEYGQKFGDWLLHIDSTKSENRYGNLVLFSKQEKSDIFIKADEGAVSQKEGYFNLSLKEGKAYNILQEEIQMINFSQMQVNKPSSMTKLRYSNIIDFWNEWIKKNPRDLSVAILTALFPILSLLMIASLGVVNPRYEKNITAVYAIFFSTLYYSMIYVFGQNYPLYSVFAVPFVWLFISYLIYRKRIKGVY
ncbi:MAG: lipopolysaccharide export system permease protein [Campylobacterota bacterium]|nr:lipopolysaccharide export system permease protein [Campylobacterota bacterium]